MEIPQGILSLYEEYYIYSEFKKVYSQRTEMLSQREISMKTTVLLGFRQKAFDFGIMDLKIFDQMDWWLHEPQLP